MNPQVSVCIISYNHVKYFREAIESVLAQKFGLPFEIIISDDCSKDGTAELICEYAQRFPGLIKAYFSDMNTGMHANWAKALGLCNGRYIALLESDDYWTDPFKLQKQYDILEAYEEMVACFTEARIIYENNHSGYPWYVEGKKEIYTQEDLIQNNMMPTCTVMMRNRISDTFFPEAYYKSPFADWMIHFQNSFFGTFYYLKEVTSVYRVHGKGVWGGLDSRKQLLNRLKVSVCLEKIAADRDIKKKIRQARKNWLQKICHEYKVNREYLAYMKYRIQLLLN